MVLIRSIICYCHIKNVGCSSRFKFYWSLDGGCLNYNVALYCKNRLCFICNSDILYYLRYKAYRVGSLPYDFCSSNRITIFRGTNLQGPFTYVHYCSFPDIYRCLNSCCFHRNIFGRSYNRQAFIQLNNHVFH